MTPLSIDVFFGKNVPKVKKILLKIEKSGMQDFRTSILELRVFQDQSSQL